MIKYFLEAAGTTNVSQPFAHKDLAVVTSCKDKLPMCHQGELSPSKSSPSPAAPPLRVLPSSRAFRQGRVSGGNPRYLKLNAFSSKLFISS